MCDKNLYKEINPDDDGPLKLRKIVLMPCCNKLAHQKCQNLSIVGELNLHFFRWEVKVAKKEGRRVTYMDSATRKKVTPKPPRLPFVNCGACKERLKPDRRIPRYAKDVDLENDNYVGQEIASQRTGDCSSCIQASNFATFQSADIDFLRRSELAQKRRMVIVKRELAAQTAKSKELRKSIRHLRTENKKLRRQRDNRLRLKEQQLATAEQQRDFFIRQFSSADRDFNRAKRERDYYIRRSRFAEDLFDTTLERINYPRVFNPQNHPSNNFRRRSPDRDREE